MKILSLPREYLIPGKPGSTTLNAAYSGIPATYSQALGKDIFFAQAISADGLTQKLTDQLKDGLVQEYVYNSIGLASEIKSQERRTAIHRDNSGLEKKAFILDIRANKTIISSDFRHTFTEADGMRIKQDTTKEDTFWADYSSGIILGKGSEKLNPWGNALEEITRSADGIDQKFVPEYGPGASEIGGKTYRYNSETGEWVLEKIHSDNQWNQGELTRKTSDEFKGRKETIETFSPDGLLREEAERFTLSNEYGYFVGIAQRGRAYIYDGSSVVNNPLIADRGRTVVTADIDGIKYTTDYSESKVLSFAGAREFNEKSQASLIIQLTDSRNLTWFETKDTYRRNRTDNSWVEFPIDNDQAIQRLTTNNFTNKNFNFYDAAATSNVDVLYPDGHHPAL